MELSTSQQQTQKNALTFARKNKKAIARDFTDKAIYSPEDEPVSVFMAGSPGAGKTEASIALIEDLSAGGMQVLRIDPDELRNHFPEYCGSNSWLFQGAVSILVERIHDLVLKQKQSFLLDGTLSNYDIAARNIARSLKKGRVVQILYVYQKPELAWEFVLARERAEGRKIPVERFIEQYFAARNVVNRLKNEFSEAIGVDLLLKNNDNSNRFYKAGIQQIDPHIPEAYSPEELAELIRLK
ncbi:MAG: zeta toxin family protein [Xanthomonadales bacterium]|nr:zeta toxin family protein [Xanthomonadales bacterium]